LKTPVSGFSVVGKHFVNGAFRKRWRHDKHGISLPAFSSNTNPQNDPRLLRFQISLAQFGRKPFDVFSELKRQFKNLSGVVWMGP